MNTDTIRKTARTALAPTLTILSAVIVVLILSGIVLALLGKNPVLAGQRFLEGALGTESSRADVLMFALPLLITGSGLLITFTAGLWNIGVEGQITMGALFATIVARSVTQDTPAIVALPLEIVLAMIGGGLWAALTALLKIYGNINEIFGGVALNFVAQNILISLLKGPWKGATTPQTADFLAPALFPRVSETIRLSPLAIGVGLVAFLIVFFLLRGTHWGLQLKAMGLSEKSARLLGVRTHRNIFLAMVACGMLAGLAGATQALFTRGRLIPGISGGVGFLAVLLVLLVNVRAIWIPLVALLLALFPVGGLKLSTALESSIQLDAALGNVIQSAFTLAVLLAGGVRAQMRGRSRQQPSSYSGKQVG